MAETNVKPKKGSKQAQLEAIAAQVKGCTLCPLWKSRTNAVPGVGNPEAEIVFIGEGPGWHEDQQALPFVGPSGQLLDKMLASIGIKRDDVFITNIVKCRPPNNRDPMPNEISTCHPYLQAQLDIIRPRVIVTLGRHSMNLFLPDAKITQVHGQPHRDANSGMMIVPMFHPAAALRTPAWMDALKQDFQKLPSLLKELDDQPRPTPPVVTNESPAAEVVAAALEEVSPAAAEAIIAPEVRAEVEPDVAPATLTAVNAPDAAEPTTAKAKRGKKADAPSASGLRKRINRLPDAQSDAVDIEESTNIEAHTTPSPGETTDIAAQFIAPHTGESAGDAPSTDEPVVAEAKPRRSRKAAPESDATAVEEQSIAPSADSTLTNPPTLGAETTLSATAAGAVTDDETPDAAWDELTGAVEALTTEKRRGRPRKATPPEPEEQTAPNEQTAAAQPKSSRRKKEEEAGQMSLF